MSVVKQFSCKSSILLIHRKGLVAGGLRKQR